MQDDRDYAAQALGSRFCLSCGKLLIKTGPYSWQQDTHIADTFVVNGVTVLHGPFTGGVPQTRQCFEFPKGYDSCTPRCFICNEPSSTERWHWRFIECFPRRICTPCFSCFRDGAHLRQSVEV